MFECNKVDKDLKFPYPDNSYGTRKKLLIPVVMFLFDYQPLRT